MEDGSEIFGLIVLKGLRVIRRIGGFIGLAGWLGYKRQRILQCRKVQQKAEEEAFVDFNFTTLC